MQISSAAVKRTLMCVASRISCSQLGQIKVPVVVAKGQQSRSFFTILADTTQRCIPGARIIVTPNAGHMAPAQNASAFNAALLTHLDGQ